MAGKQAPASHAHIVPAGDTAAGVMMLHAGGSVVKPIQPAPVQPEPSYAKWRGRAALAPRPR